MAPLPDRMTAIAIRAPGGPDMLVAEQRAVPQPGPGEILVKVEAAGVNRPDVMQRQGLYPPPAGAPDIPGLEICGIVAALGEELMVEDESYIDMATALSATGPTYVFLLMEALVDAGVHLGFSRRVAEELVLRTVEGSALFARKSGRHLAELRNMVTSPGGTSAAAIYQLEKGSLRTVLSKAVYAAYQRATELGATAERKVTQDE